MVDLRVPEHRRHLELDVRLAEELGIRYGDSFRGKEPLEETHRRRERCTDASFSVITRLHRVAEPQITLTRGARDLWIDLLVVFVPMALLFVLLSDRITRRVDRSFDAEDRWPKLISLAALAPIVGGAGLMITQLWEWGVEWIRLGDSHLSYRAFRLPGQEHAVLIWICAMGLFACVAVARYRALRFRGAVVRP